MITIFNRERCIFENIFANNSPSPNNNQITNISLIC